MTKALWGALIALTVFVCLQDPAQQGIWIVASGVSTLLKPIGCAPGSNTKIITTSGAAFCVRETPQQVMKLLEHTKEEK